MLEPEARWIGDWLAQQPTSAISPLLNLGSDTRRFRTDAQPWVDEHIFAPLRARGVLVVHCDVKEGRGVDLVADLRSPQGHARLAAISPRVVLCTNVLEHVVGPEDFARRYLSLLEPGGLAIVTTPFAYPFHRDPIDTMFRPSIDALVALHPGTALRASATVTAGSFANQALSRPSRLVSELAALPRLILSGRGVRASRLRFLWKSYSANCCVFERVW
jgi:hypothetical protein